MLGVYNYTVILTYVGMLTGFGGVLFAFDGNLRSALICLVIAGVCDMFDGKIASTMERTRQEKRFGIQIDSLSDLICFGVLPALIVWTCDGGKLRFLSPSIYLLCALIRLAWFNVDEEERQDREGKRRKVYLGLPVTSAAVIFPLVTGLGSAFQWPLHGILPVVALLTAAAFLTPFRVRKPSLSGKHVPPPESAEDEGSETDQLAEAK